MPTSKEERQRRTALMRKCGCGNVAAHNSNYCGACEPKEDFEIEMLRYEIQLFDDSGDRVNLVAALTKITDMLEALRG